MAKAPIVIDLTNLFETVIALRKQINPETQRPWTQEALAEAIGISQTTISELERKDPKGKGVGLDVLIPIARFTGKSLDWLTGHKAAEPPKPDAAEVARVAAREVLGELLRVQQRDVDERNAEREGGAKILHPKHKVPAQRPRAELEAEFGKHGARPGKRDGFGKGKKVVTVVVDTEADKAGSKKKA